MSTDLLLVNTHRYPIRIWRRWLGVVAATLLVITAIYYSQQTILLNKQEPVHLIVYGFSTQEEVFTQRILPAFREAWEAETDQDITIEAVFGASGTLVEQINKGAPADVAVLSSVHDASLLETGSGLRNANEAIVFGYTPMVIVIRPDSAAYINGFVELTTPGLRLLHADPRSSGAGVWSLLAEYGNAWQECSEEVSSETQIKSIWANVRFLAPSARTTLTLFEQGVGDAFITYEQDALLAQARGVSLDILIPPCTIVAEPVAVIVTKNVTAVEQPVVEAFQQYLLSDECQEIFGEYFLRTAHSDNEAFPNLSHYFTVADLGGWEQAYTQTIEPLWQANIEPRLNLDASPILMTGDSQQNK